MLGFIAICKVFLVEQLLGILTSNLQFTPHHVKELVWTPSSKNEKEAGHERPIFKLPAFFFRQDFATANDCHVVPDVVPASVRPARELVFAVGHRRINVA